MAQLRAASRDKTLLGVFGKDSSDHPTERVPPFSANRRKAVVLLWTTFHPLHSPADDSTAEFAGRKGKVSCSLGRKPESRVLPDRTPSVCGIRLTDLIFYTRS